MPPVVYADITIGTFNVRGIVKKEKQESLGHDAGSYNVMSKKPKSMGLVIISESESTNY